MAINIVLYSKKYQKQWDQFVLSSNNGTLFHTQLFLSYHKKSRFPNKSLLFFNNKKLLSVLPATKIKNEKDIIFSSHGGASYGGFIYGNDLDIEVARELVKGLIEYSKKMKYSKIHITPPPIIYQKRFSNNIEFALHTNNFQLRKRELTSIVNLKNTNGAILDLYKPEARTAYRKAIKSEVIIRDSNNYKAFYKILSLTLKKRFQVSPAHTLKELLHLKKMFPNDISLKAAYFQKKLIAGVVNFVCNKQVMLAFYISQDYNFQHLRPLNAIFYEIFKDCLEIGFDYYDFGLFTVDMEPNLGLAKFKESLGGTGIFRDYFELILV